MKRYDLVATPRSTSSPEQIPKLEAGNRIRRRRRRRLKIVLNRSLSLTGGRPFFTTLELF